ncbi:MAG: TetR/AcrR family transcriptional regulator [Saccharofermentanales bacterium]
MKRAIDYLSLKGSGNPLLKFPSLYDAALNEFSSNAYDDASLNEIIRTSGISKGSVYHHFGDKFGLLISLLDILVAKKTEFFMPLLSKQDPAAGIFKTLKGISHATMDYMFEQPLNYQLSMRLLEYDQKLMNEISEYFPFDFSKGFSVLVRNAISSGQIRKDLPEEFVTKLLELFFSNINNIMTSKNPEEVHIAIDRVMDVLENGIAMNERRTK